MAKKSQITVTSRADLNKTRNTVLARRLAGNVFGGGTREIPLKEPEKWYTRIENNYADESMLYRMVHELGYEPLKPEDLACKPDEIGFRISEDGNLVRGEKGQEMIFKMTKEDRKALDAETTARNMRGIGSAKKTREDIANAAATAHGSEAADFLHKMPGEVLDTITGGEAQ